MASLQQWDTSWINRFKERLATDITTLNVYPEDPLAWMTVKDLPYGTKIVERPIRRPDQEIQVTKEEQFDNPKYAESLVIKLDMPVLSDELHVREEYYAGDVANAMGHVADLAKNFKDGIRNFTLNGKDSNPIARGLLESSAESSGDTTLEDPGHADIDDPISTNGKWDVYADVAKDLAEMEMTLVDKGFFGQKGILAHPLVKPLVENYVVTNTATNFQQILGYPFFYHPMVDSGADMDSAAVYMVDTSMFELYMTPIKARSFWENVSENYVWRWKTRAIPMALPKWDGTDWVKGIVGFSIDATT